MKKNLLTTVVCLGFLSAAQTEASAQINMLQDYKNNNSAAIGTFQGISFREAGFSGIYPVAGSNGKEYWICSDRGVNVDAANANPSACRPTYDKIYAFPTYAPKIHRVRLNGDSVQILQTITMKRPDGTGATGIINPTGFGSTAAEVASTDTVLNCANFNAKVAAKDIWGIDAEGLAVDKDGNFWVCEEGGPTIWKMNPNGVVIKRYTPFANVAGAQPQDVQIDSVFKYRKNNRGFEGITIAPNGKIYAVIQSPILYPTTAIGEASRVHRILEIDPATNATRMFAYLNDGVIGTGSNQIRLKDWKIGDMAAINDSTFLVLEAALRGTTDIKRVYKININGATNVNSGLYGGLTLEALVDSTGLAGKSIVPVKKTLFMDLLANAWPSALDKAEGLAILNDSTIVICNDNDYGQSSPAENGIATATTNLSHVFKYGLQGTNKLTGFIANVPTLGQGVTGQSSSQAPYLVSAAQNVKFTSIITATDVVGGYKMCGTPDGLGAFDNGNGTFTLVSNHEFGNTSGVARAHGSAGAFVSKWIINKNDLSVVSGGDLIQRINLWNTLTNSYTTYNSAFPSANAAMGRFCSADMPAISAFYNSATGKGTQERMFMNGEETGNEGRAFAHIVTGPNGGTSYELPLLGKFSFENAVACPAPSDTTIVIGMDDSTPGQVYVYVGNKTNSGTEIEKAGLTNGKLFGIAVNGLLTETSAGVPAPNTAFSMVSMGNVQNMTGATLQTNSNNAGVTQFLRPEDGAWDPSNPNDFYFATTNSVTSPSRLWKLHFTNISNPSLGGTVTAVLDGTEGQKMLDNLTIDHFGHILLTEDVGGNVHLGRVLQYDIATDVLKTVGVHDSTRFLSNGANYLTQDEEASGILDVQEILGPGMFLLSDQAHYGIAGEVVEGGQLLAMYNPDTYNANPEVSLQGNGINIESGDITPATADNTDFGNVKTGVFITKTFDIKNAGPGSLVVKSIALEGANAADFALVTPPAFPFNVAVNGTQAVTVQFTPAVNGDRTASLKVMNNDFNESDYKVAIKGTGVSPEINLKGNNQNISNGDLTAGLSNHTDFGSVNINATQTRTFTIQNTGLAELVVNSIAFSGANAGEFTLTAAPTFPLNIAVGATKDITVQFAPLSAGIRSSVITIVNDDADESNYMFALQGIGNTPTGINNVSAANGFAKLYPNPTGDAATIELTLKKAEHIIVSVFGVDGKEVMQAIDQRLNAGEQHLIVNTSSLVNGTYFVQIASESQVTKMKMVVQH